MECVERALCPADVSEEVTAAALDGLNGVSVELEDSEEVPEVLLEPDGDVLVCRGKSVEFEMLGEMLSGTRRELGEPKGAELF